MNQFGAQKFSFKKPLKILMFIGIGIGSVSADMKKILSAIYRIGRFEKWDLSVLIGIGRYEKKLIGRTLNTSCSRDQYLKEIRDRMECQLTIDYKKSKNVY